MINENLLIAQRIRAARLQRNLTQQDLADKFGKTSAAISDIERGKTQITAADLIIFSDLLIKPIEYFFGEDFGDPETQDLIALMRRLPPDMRKQQLPLMTMMLKMAEINYKMQVTEEKEKQDEAFQEFYEIFLPYYNMMDATMEQLKEAKGNLDTLMGSLYEKPQT
jgi:transcriptional regulator with XRE-family HTH domain